MGLLQKLEKQINKEYNYWENALRRAIAVVCTLTEHGIVFRGTNEKFGSLQNGNYLGMLVLISFWQHILQNMEILEKETLHAYPKLSVKNSLKLWLQKSMCSCEVMSSGYFSLSVDSTPVLPHIGQLSVVFRYVVDIYIYILNAQFVLSVATIRLK